MMQYPAWLVAKYKRLLPNWAEYILAEIEGAKTILDIGCGPCSIVGRRKSGFAVGVDCYQPYLDHARRCHTHDAYLKRFVMQLRYPSQTFDVVLASEVLEHLHKSAGLVLLTRMEQWGRKVIVKVPNGWVPQGPIAGNPYQTHLSAWSLEDLQALGYTVTGASGWKPLRGTEGKVKLWPYWIGDRISDATQPLVRNRPRHAFQLFGVKCLS